MTRGCYCSVLAVLAAMLLDRRLIFTSSSIPTLSGAIVAATSLLNPFVWEHIFIPVLPADMLFYCCAPMPFLIGVPSYLLPQLETMPLEEVSLLSSCNV